MEDFFEAYGFGILDFRGFRHELTLLFFLTSGFLPFYPDYTKTGLRNYTNDV